MAALVAGVQYGLSSHSNFHENKSLIFVKLTDSAQRAIEDFLRNRNKLKQNPTIQFVGNEGKISFPSPQSIHGTANFSFSLAGNQDIEGPQGGFECVQQTGPKSLESLGPLSTRMRIHATDDVYETTKHRMVVAEENIKNKCTKMIKSNGSDIGRKVKVKVIGRTIPPPVNVIRQRESPSLLTSGANSSRFPLSSSSSTSSSSTSSSSTSSSSLSSSSKSISRNPLLTRSKPEKQLPDITRTPIRERLIHLLALRSYKKPELYERINREGIKDKDRKVLFEVLMDLTFTRDNAYHLKRTLWNDVQDNWIHYTEQEKAILKRRKPQNLTPPGSSDGGSSGSGQSPNSVHPGSPPAISAPSALLNSKRPGYYEGNDGLPTKKPRISHYRKPEPIFVNHGDNRRTAGSGVNSGDSRINSGDNRINSADSRFSSADRVSDSVNSVENIGGSNSGSCNSRSSLLVGENSNWNQRQQSHLKYAERTTNNDVVRSSSYNSTSLCLSSDSEDDQDHAVQHPKLSANDRSNITNSSNVRETSEAPANICEPHTSPDPSNNVTDNASTQRAHAPIPREEYPDYLTCYTKVSSLEQRRRYKDEFNSLYSEYKKLYAYVHPIKSRYNKYEQQYQQMRAQGNQHQLEMIRLQILKDYHTINNDPVYRQRNSRYDYLHGKLQHLKSLVEEYDKIYFGTSNNSNTIPQGKENQHY